MQEDALFTLVGIRPSNSPVSTPRKHRRKIPVISFLLLGLILLCCFGAEFIMTKDPTYLDFMHYTHPPNREFLFGTDTLGRDIFSCIWYGGGISLCISFLATGISTVIAIIYGAFSGIAPAWLDTLLMRFTEICLSIPTLLIIVFMQAIWGDANVLSISIVIGITSWCSMAKIIRTEVRQLRQSEYVIASRCMGGGFFHILRCHLAPNFVSSIMFMVVMNIRSAIVSESTLSFMGMGLPLEVISWGSMLSLAEKALMTRAFWIILIPGTFLVVLLMCITNIGNWFRKSINHTESNL